jgi:hypothetical protein
MEQISCMLEIESSNKKPGVLFFKNGSLYDASCEDLQGESAALKLLPQKIATFRFKVLPVKKISKQIHSNLSELFHKIGESG